MTSYSDPCVSILRKSHSRFASFMTLSKVVQVTRATCLVTLGFQCFSWYFLSSSKWGGCTLEQLPVSAQWIFIVPSPDHNPTGRYFRFEAHEPFNRSHSS